MEEKQALARERRRKMMLEDPMLRVIPKIAVPMIISSLIDSIYNLVDTLFVSQLGVHATAAVAVNDSLMHILRAVSMGFAIGASSYISRRRRTSGPARWAPVRCSSASGSPLSSAWCVCCSAPLSWISWA